MKSTGRYSAHEEVEMNPEKPFLEDIKKDMEKIDKYFTQKVGNEIRKKMINEILKKIV